MRIRGIANSRATPAAQHRSERPSLVISRTARGNPSHGPPESPESVDGSPLGSDNPADVALDHRCGPVSFAPTLGGSRRPAPLPRCVQLRAGGAGNRRTRQPAVPTALRRLPPSEPKVELRREWHVRPRSPRFVARTPGSADPRRRVSGGLRAEAQDGTHAANPTDRQRDPQPPSLHQPRRHRRTLVV